MVQLKTDKEIDVMNEAGRIVADALALIEKTIAPGVTTGELDELVETFIRERGGVPTFKGYRVGRNVYPASICASVDEEVVHGIPGPRVLEEGRVVSVDIGVTYKGFVGDSARTFAVGRIDDDVRRLLDVTETALMRAVETVRPGSMLSDIGRAVQTYVESAGFNVVKKFVGHGIGRKMHEDPQIPNYVDSNILSNDLELRRGMVLAIEPMVNQGTDDVRVLKDGWTVVTRDGRPSAHFEHTVAVVKDGYRILTLPS